MERIAVKRTDGDARAAGALRPRAAPRRRRDRLQRLGARRGLRHPSPGRQARRRPDQPLPAAHGGRRRHVDVPPRPPQGRRSPTRSRTGPAGARGSSLTFMLGFGLLALFVRWMSVDEALRRRIAARIGLSSSSAAGRRASRRSAATSRSSRPGPSWSCSPWSRSPFWPGTSPTARGGAGSSRCRMRSSPCWPTSSTRRSTTCVPRRIRGARSLPPTHAWSGRSPRTACRATRPRRRTSTCSGSSPTSTSAAALPRA